MAVCVLPGTELAFAGDIACLPVGLLAMTIPAVGSGGIGDTRDRD
jgi:hypothetical protein